MMPKKLAFNTFAEQPQATPMPGQMSVQEASSYISLQNVPKELLKIDGTDDYPNGRGGMQAVPMVSGEHSTKSITRPGTPIGPRPPANRMPTNS